MLPMTVPAAPPSLPPVVPSMLPVLPAPPAPPSPLPPCECLDFWDNPSSYDASDALDQLESGCSEESGWCPVKDADCITVQGQKPFGDSHPWMYCGDSIIPPCITRLRWSYPTDTSVESLDIDQCYDYRYDSLTLGVGDDENNDNNCTDRFSGIPRSSRYLYTFIAHWRLPYTRVVTAIVRFLVHEADDFGDIVVFGLGTRGESMDDVLTQGEQRRNEDFFYDGDPAQGQLWLQLQLHFHLH